MADTANSVIKSNFVARYGPMRAGFGVKNKDSRFWTDVDGRQRGLNLADAILITAARTILPKETGTLFVFNSIATLIATLPAPARGLTYSFFCLLSATSGNGHTISVNAAGDILYGQTAAGVALASTAGKGLTNTQATGAVGDSVEFTSDGTNWFVRSIQGIWKREA